MSRLVVYDNELLFDKEIRCKLFHEIGRGSEGICYEYNGFAYKVLFDKNIMDYIGGILDYMENPSQILTIDDIDLPSFAFPEKVYAIKDWLLGYRTKLIKNNLFNGETFYSPEDLANINFNDLAKAYKIKASIKNDDIDSYLEDVNKQLRLKK